MEMTSSGTRRILHRLEKRLYISRTVGKRGKAYWSPTAIGMLTLEAKLAEKLKRTRFEADDPNTFRFALEELARARTVQRELRDVGWIAPLIHKALKSRTFARIRSTLRAARKRAKNVGAYAYTCLLDPRAKARRFAAWAAVCFKDMKELIPLFLRAVAREALTWKQGKRLTRELKAEWGCWTSSIDEKDLERAMARTRVA